MHTIAGNFYSLRLYAEIVDFWTLDAEAIKSCCWGSYHKNSQKDIFFGTPCTSSMSFRSYLLAHTGACIENGRWWTETREQDVRRQHWPRVSPRECSGRCLHLLLAFYLKPTFLYLSRIWSRSGYELWLNYSYPVSTTANGRYAILGQRPKGILRWARRWKAENIEV